MAITATTDHAVFTFPAVWYVFGNQRVGVALRSGHTAQYVTLTIGGVTERRTLVDGVAEFDLSPFLRATLNPNDINRREADGHAYKLLTGGSVAVSVNDIASGTTGTAVSVNVPYLYAGKLAEATPSAVVEECTTYYTAWPCDISLLTADTSNIGVRYNGSTGTASYPTTNPCGVRIDCDAWRCDDAPFVDVTYNRLSVQQGAVVGIPTRLRVYIDNDACGVYLRWLAADGRTHYKLFKLATDTQTTESGERYTVGMADDYVDGWSRGAGMYRNAVNVTRTLTLAAACQRRELMPELMTLLGSDFVDIYDEATQKWTRVDVVDAQVTDNGKRLQDFAVQVVIPTITPQTR